MNMSRESNELAPRNLKIVYYFIKSDAKNINYHYSTMFKKLMNNQTRENKS